VNSAGAEKEEQQKEAQEGREVTPRGIELFHLGSDPDERSNVAEAHPQRVQSMYKRLRKYQSEALEPKGEARPQGFVVPKVWGE
jgi:hypothetical protein